MGRQWLRAWRRCMGRECKQTWLLLSSLEALLLLELAALLTNHLSLELIHCHGTLHPCTDVFFQWLPLSVITRLLSMNDMPFID